MSEVRYAGYLEGMQSGRRTIAAAVRDVLEDEGMWPRRD
jgi:hypothetical protein